MINNGNVQEKNDDTEWIMLKNQLQEMDKAIQCLEMRLMKLQNGKSKERNNISA